MLTLIPVAAEIDPLVTLVIVATLLWVLIAYETWRFVDMRDRMRHHLA